MPVIVDVGARPDERSFKQVGDRIEKYFVGVGKLASEGFTKSYAAGAKDVQKATASYTKAYDAIADAAGRAKTAEKERQRLLDKSKSLADAAAKAEKNLGAARDSGDTKAAADAEKELDRIREQSARTNTQIVRSAEAVARSRRQEQRDVQEAVSAYRELEQAQRRASNPNLGRTFDSYSSRGPGMLSGLTSQSSGIVGQFQGLGGSAGKGFVAGAAAAILAGGLISVGAQAADMVVGGFKSVMDTGIDFQKTVNNFQGVTQSTATQTEQMSAAARALGSDTSLAGASASDAALAMTELAKAGFSVDEAIGASRGTLELATAGQLDAAKAAEIQANAINAFKLSAADAPRVADVLANADIGSSAGITDIAQALQQVGGISRGFGEDINDTVGALMMFANAGVKGSDAGTLLKTTLQSITDQGNPAQNAIQNLGLSLYNFDTGQFVGFRELFRQLDEAKARMKPEQFQAQANILFGSDAMRSAMLGTVADFDKAVAKTYELGAASGMAKAQMQGWPGVVEGVHNSMEALKLSLFDIFNSPAGQDFGNKIVASLDGLVTWVNTHKPEIIGFVTGFVSAMATAADAFLTYVARMLDAGAVMQEALSNSFGVVIGGLANFAEAIGSVLKHVPGMKSVGEGLEGAGRSVEGMMANWRNAGNAMGAMADGIDQTREGLRGLRDEFTGSMRLTQAAEEQSRRYTQSFKDLSKAVELVPDTKAIVLKDNSPEVIEKLKSLGFAVQNLPNGQITIRVDYRDPSGKIIDPNQLGVSQRQRDDATSRQHSWFPAAPAAAPTPVAPAGGWPAMSSGGGGGGGGSGDAPAPFVDPSIWQTADPAALTGFGANTREAFDAQSQVISAGNSLNESKLKLARMEAEGVTDQLKLLQAKNQVQQDERAYQSAQAKLVEAQQGTLKKQTDSANQFSQGMDKIGAALDSDFGIAQGLPGIADNLVRFVASLAFAPALGALSAVSAASGGPQATGSGLMGIMAANGAFGSQFMPAAINPSAMGPMALQPGMNPNLPAMMSLAQQSSGNTAYGPASDLADGLADCSGSISDLVEVLQTGRSSPARLFDTTAFASDEQAAKLGFQPGYMPGALNVGVNPYPGQSGHMAATLPNGINFEGGGSTGGGAQYGGSAAGALDPQFEKQYYMPVGAPAAPDLYSPANTSPGLNNPLGGGGGGGGGLNIPGFAAPPAALPGSSSLGLPPAPTFAGSQARPFSAAGSAGVPAPGAAGPGAMPSVTGGMAPAASGGAGFSGLSGAPMAALGAAAGGLDMLAPGAGAAAQIGMQEINRAVAQAGKVAGIGVSGLMETFLPSGSPLGNVGNSWFGKLAGGLSGAKPALPNMAGQAAPPKPEVGPGSGGQSGQGAGGKGDINVEYHNHQATEDRAGADLVSHLRAGYQGPGR